MDHAYADVLPWGLAGDRRWMIVDEDGVGVTQRLDPRLVDVRPEVRPGGLVLRAGDRPRLDVPEPAGGDPVGVRVFAHRPPVPALPAGAPAHDWLCALLDRKVRLVWLADPTRHRIRTVPPGEPAGPVSFADAYPLLLTNEASLYALNGWLRDAGGREGPLPMNRFRPNVVIDGAGPWVEDGWTGGRIRIGSVVFRAAEPCDRCVVTTTDQDTGERGREPLRALAAHRNVDQKLLFGLNLVPELDGATGRLAVGDPIRFLA